MKIDLEEFRVKADEKVELEKRPTRVRPYCKSKQTLQRDRLHVELDSCCVMRGTSEQAIGA